MKKIAIITHSAVNLRQQLFFEELANQGAKVLVLAPKKWTHYKVKDYKKKNYEFKTIDVSDEGNIVYYQYSRETYHKLRKFKPNLIYSQTEFWQAQSRVSLGWAKELNIPLYFFFWENIKEPNEDQADLITDATGIICGNMDAEDIVKPYHNNVINLPQVGVDTERFKPMDIKKDIDVLYLGRLSKEKGIDFIKKAYPKAKFVSDASYFEVPKLLSRAKLFVSFPYEIETWKEQGGYAYLEALSCETPIICSESGSLPEWLSGCIAVRFVEQKNVRDLKEAIQQELNFTDSFDRGGKGRDFVLKRYSNQVVAKKLLRFFNE